MENYIIAKATHEGQTRHVNEDSLGVFSTPNGQVLVICDGMGGQAAGDVASKLAVSIIESILIDNRFSDPDEAIRGAIIAANQGVLHRAAQDPSLEGMGSTCVMLIVQEGKVHAGWVGDSRIYYVANHTIRQISHDQSYVQQLVDSGQMTQAEAAHHPQSNEITNCIGLNTMTPPVTLPVPITPAPGSIFLLCSDGLTGMVDDSRIERVLSTDNLTLQQKADRLIEMANEAGGLDNITIELLQFGTSATVGATSGTLFDVPVETKTSKKSHLWMWVATIFVVIVAAIGAYWYFFLHTEPVSTPSKKVKTEVNKKDTNNKKSSSEGVPKVEEQKVTVKTVTVEKKSTPVQKKTTKGALTGKPGHTPTPSNPIKKELEQPNPTPTFDTQDPNLRKPKPTE